MDALDRTRMSGVRLFVRVLASASRYDALVLNGSIGSQRGYVDLIAAAFLARRRHGPAVIISDCTWGRGTWWLDRLACALGLRLLDHPRITYCVLSAAEQQTFPRLWGVDPRRVACTLFPWTLTAEGVDAPTQEGGGVFAGGDSMRDYRPLVEAAALLPVPVTLAVSRVPKDLPTPLPPNVRAGRVPRPEFFRLMRCADVVVVPMPGGAERSAGQQTYLNAMALGKLVVVTDSCGVREYVEPGRTGLVVPPGDTAALRDALLWALDPAHAAEVQAIRAAGRQAARERFGPDNYVQMLLAVVDRAAA